MAENLPEKGRRPTCVLAKSWKRVTIARNSTGFSLVLSPFRHKVPAAILVLDPHVERVSSPCIPPIVSDLPAHDDGIAARNRPFSSPNSAFPWPYNAIFSTFIAARPLHVSAKLRSTFLLTLPSGRLLLIVKSGGSGRVLLVIVFLEKKKNYLLGPANI